MESEIHGENVGKLPSPSTWKLLADDGKGEIKVSAGSRKLTLKLQPPKTSGDETVPAQRSARQAHAFQFAHGMSGADGYEHQSSYSHPHVLASMLYAIVRIAKTAKWSGS